MSTQIKSMEAKKKQSNSSVKTENFGLFQKLADVKAEFKKISWTPKDELKMYTKMVVISTLAFGMVIYFIDIIIQSCLTSIGFIVRLIFG